MAQVTKPEKVEWHGWSRGFTSPEKAGPALHVGPLPGRKSIALYVAHRGVIRVLAYFATADVARECVGALDHIMFKEAYP